MGAKKMENFIELKNKVLLAGLQRVYNTDKIFGNQCAAFFFAGFFFHSPCSSLFWLHFNPGVHIIPFQVILFYLATGPHLHAVGEVAGSGRQDEVVNQGSTCSSNDWANPEDLKYRSKLLHQVFLHLKIL